MKTKKAHKKTHQCWRDMQQRCYNPNNKKYPIYGGRGITISDRWLESYNNFLEDMGEKPEGYTIDRIDNSKGYSKENCRWATPKQQAYNRRTNRFVTYKGQTKTLMEWCEELGWNHNKLRKRLESMPLEKAFSLEDFSNQAVPETIKQEILNRYYTENISQKNLGKIYNICQGTISKWVVKERKINDR